MKSKINYLKLYRKHSPLVQEDVKIILNLNEVSQVSRYELGSREPSIEFVICYCIIFNTKLDEFYREENNFYLTQIKDRISNYLELLRANNTGKNIQKVKYLEQVLLRLTTN